MRLDLPSELRETFRMVIPVRWGDMDALGHVNNTVYFRYFETVRMEWLRAGRVLPDSGGVGPLMANGFCNFRRQVNYPCDLLAVHYLGRAGRSSLDTYFTLAPADAPDQIAADGGGTLVWFDAVTQQTVALPDAVRALAVPG